MKRLILTILIGAMSFCFWACASTKEKTQEEASEIGGFSEDSGENASSEDFAGELSDSSEVEADESVEAGDDIELPEAEALDDTVRNAVNGFNWKLYDETGEDNIFYSAYSIESALAMADLAADGKSKSEIESALGIDDLQTFAEQYKLLREKETVDTAKITTANSIWIEKSLELAENADEDFNKPAKFYFDGEFKTVDFKNNFSAVNSDISNWVKENTGNLIEDYESSANSDTVADILNAVYFYGEWQNKFEADDTYKQDFKGKSATNSVDMMHSDDSSFRYLAECNGITALALPYSGSEIEMDILMSSDEDRDISEAFATDKADEIFEALDKADETDIKLTVPKFTMDYSFDDLKTKLENLGIKEAFSESADFSKLAKNLMVTDISHRARVEVDEEGSRAAAVTEMTFETTAVAPIMNKTEFTVDRPFIFVIRDKESGVIFFTGRVVDLT